MEYLGHLNNNDVTFFVVFFLSMRLHIHLKGMGHKLIQVLHNQSIIPFQSRKILIKLSYWCVNRIEIRFVSIQL